MPPKQNGFVLLVVLLVVAVLIVCILQEVQADTALLKLLSSVQGKIHDKICYDCR